MSQPNGRGEFLRTIERETRLATLERNPLQKAYDDYYEMERQRDQAVRQAEELVTDNNALLSEVGMLREQFKRSEADRIRFQSISSTLLGRLLAINDTIAGAVKASLSFDERPELPLDDETERQSRAEEADLKDPDFLSDADRAVTDRYGLKPADKVPPEPRATPVPPLTVGGAMPAVDWNPTVSNGER
jgi:hypothetical protein